MSSFEELVRSLGYDCVGEAAAEGLTVLKVSKDGLSFIALVFSDEECHPRFLRLMFVLDTLRTEDLLSHYETLLELNRECWMGAYAVDVASAAVLYVYNFPLEQFDAEALAAAVENFHLARTLYEDAAEAHE